MIIVLKKNADVKKVNELENNLKDMGFALHISDGESSKIVGLVGDTTKLSQDDLLANEIIEDVKRIQEPYKKANRKMHPEDTVVDVNGIKIGGGHFQVIAGPCSVESKEQMEEVASDVKASYVAAHSNQEQVLTLSRDFTKMALPFFLMQVRQLNCL